MRSSGKKPPLKTLDRVLSKAGLGSRADARLWIAAGQVRVNGRVVTDPDRWVDMKTDRVVFDGRPLAVRDRVYVLLHKPAGYVTTRKDPQGRRTVYDLIADIGTFVSPVGRLDLESSGLLLLTNDTQLAERVTNPESHVPKTYVVEVSRRLTDREIERLRAGVELSDGVTRAAKVARVSNRGDDRRLQITLTEGRNRQIRRMVEAIGADVLTLTRVKIGNVDIGRLPVGSWRKLTKEEVALLASRSR